MRELAAGTQLGEYIVGEHLDEGGMGAIYRAHKPGSNEPLVVKVLLPIFNSDIQFRKRFEREVTLLQTLKNPYIIPIYSFGEQGGILYFIMPFINGQSLHKMLQKQHFSPATAWMILEPLTKALDFAHHQHIIHRDLKPANILVQFDPNGNQYAIHPFLADFGLSKPVDKSTLTEIGISVGTPQYMSPEQVRAQPVSPQTDVYALGTVVYQMLLGRVPFAVGNPETIALQQVNDPPPAPHTLHPDFPLPLEAVIQKALAKYPADRYETAGAFGAAYWKAIQSVPLKARMTEYWINR